MTSTPGTGDDGAGVRTGPSDAETRADRRPSTSPASEATAESADTVVDGARPRLTTGPIELPATAETLGALGTLRDRLAAAVALGRSAVLSVRDQVRRHPVLGEIYEIVDGVFIDYGRDHGAMYAGALTFYAILSLIPLSVLLASAFGFVMSTTGEASLDDALTEVVRQLRKIIPYLQPSFTEDLRALVAYRSKLGVVGFVALLWAAAEVFRGVEFATARIFARVKDHSSPDHRRTRVRSVFKTKLLFGAVATAAVMGMMLLQLVGTLLSQVRSQLSLPGWVDTIVGDPLGDASVLGVVLTALSIVVGFAVIVRVFSPHQVQMRFALFGGVLFYVFFEVARQVYDVYVSRLTDVNAMYGSFATLIVLVLWIYYCATLLLICCHAVKVAQRRIMVGPQWPKDGKLLLVA